MAEAVPLTGADCFLRAFDREVRRQSGASHASQLVLRLGKGFDPEALRAALTDTAAATPIVRAPVRRPWGVAPPVYRLDRGRRRPLPPVEVHATDAPRSESVPEVFRRRLNGRFAARRGELLRFDVVTYAGGESDLAMTWLHMLFDGAGSEHYVRWLDACHAGVRRPDDLPAGDRPDAPAGTATLPERPGARGRLARAWQQRLEAFGAHPVRSLAGPLRRLPQDLHCDVTTLPSEATAEATARAKAKAGFLTPMLFYLAAAIRAHHAVFRARGVEPGSFVVPVTVNARPRGPEEAIFRTRVSLLWFQVLPPVTVDLDGLIDALRQQRRAAIKERMVEGGVAAMDFARFAPAGLYARMARRPLRGELASFFFAFTDAFLPGLGSFLGAPIENGFHAPSVPPSPGSSAIFSVREGRLNLTHVWQRDVLSAEERAVFRRSMLADLTGSAT